MPLAHNLTPHRVADAEEISNEKNYTANSWCFIFWDGFWAIGMAFCLFPIMVPAYLLHLNASKTLIQFIVILFSSINIIQYFSNRFARRLDRKKWIFFFWTTFGFSWFFYGIIALIGDHFFSSDTKIILFSLLCLVLTVARDLGSPPLMGLTVENIPLLKRGGLAAWRSFSRGLGGLLGLFVAREIFALLPSPANFHICFIIGGLIYMLSCLPFWFYFRDNAITFHSRKFKSVRLIHTSAMLFKNSYFRSFLISFALINLALNLAPLFISYGKDALNLPAKNVIVFTAIFFVSSILFGTILPLLADRSGFKLIGMIAALLSFISFAIPLLPGTGAIALYTAYTFHSTSSMLAALLLANLGAELMPDIGPTSIIIVGSILIMPLTVVFPPLGGTLVDLFAATGYQIVFAGGAIISLLSAIILGLGVIEPRHQELLPEIFPSGTSQEP